MTTLREKLAEAISQELFGGAYSMSDAATVSINVLRQWLADEGLVVVPKSPGVVREGDWLYEAVKDASLRAAKNGSVAPQLMFAPILWAMQAALAAAPDALRDGEKA